MKFTQIPNDLKYPAILRSKLSTAHSEIINWASNNFHGTYKERKNIIDLMNSISYMYLSGDSLPVNWNINNPMINPPVVDDDVCRKYLSKLYIVEKNIDWDIDIKEDSTEHTETKSANVSVSINTSDTTPKEDLYIQSPKIPRFDKNKIWMSGEIEGNVFEIYESLPIIPTKQNEISITTDVNKFTSRDLLNLFPNNIIHTRAACMYQSVENIELHPILGLILPIQGFTRDELISNLIEYPHIYKLQKVTESGNVNFYRSIEIDEKLYDIEEIWYNLPESDIIPYTPDFIKEYVTRRYLLERDYDSVSHKYPIFGSLDKFLTLFMPSNEYESLGYNVEDIARMCVRSRVNYKITRSPIIRRLQNA